MGAMKQINRERFEVMAVRLAHHLEMSKAELFKDLPPKLQAYFNTLDYADIVMPLINEDRYKGLAYRGLSIKYGISTTEICRRLNKKPFRQ
jgi:hypothetical protein